MIQEHVRAAYHRLPYNDLPRTLVKYLVMESAKKLNYFPTKNGVSKYHRPRMILHQENLDYERHCEYHIGEYVLAHDEPKHTIQMRLVRSIVFIFELWIVFKADMNSCICKQIA
jgi:hypothetical protein